jgi:hypothetical protein
VSNRRVNSGRLDARAFHHADDEHTAPAPPKAPGDTVGAPGVAQVYVINAVTVQFNVVIFLIDRRIVRIDRRRQTEAYRSEAHKVIDCNLVLLYPSGV